MTTIESNVEKKTSQFTEYSDGLIFAIYSDTRMRVKEGQFVLITSLQGLENVARILERGADKKCKELLHRMFVEMKSVAANSQRGRVAVSLHRRLASDMFDSALLLNLFDKQAHTTENLRSVFGALTQIGCAEEKGGNRDDGIISKTLSVAATTVMTTTLANLAKISRTYDSLCIANDDLQKSLKMFEGEYTYSDESCRIEMLIAKSTTKRTNDEDSAASQYVVGDRAASTKKQVMVAMKVDATYAHVARLFVRYENNDAALFQCLVDKAEVAFDDNGRLSGALQSFKRYEPDDIVGKTQKVGSDDKNNSDDDDDDDDKDNVIQQPQSKKKRSTLN